MAGARFSVEWDPQDVARINRVLKQLLEGMDDLTPLFQDIGEYLLPSQQDRINDGLTPDGTPFKPLSLEYLESERKRRSRGADKILILDNFLVGELIYQADSDGLQVGTNKPYAATHQFGRDSIPARPFLGFTADDIDEIQAIAEDFLEDLLSA